MKRIVLITLSLMMISAPIGMTRLPCDFSAMATHLRLATGKFDLSLHNMLLEQGVDFGIFAMIVQLFIWLFTLSVFIRNAPKLKLLEYYHIYLVSCEWSNLD